MNPILILNGIEHDVYALYYKEGEIHSVSILIEGVSYRKYHDIKENVNYYLEKPLQVDFDKCLKFKNKYNEINEILENKIEKKQLEIQELANDIADEDSRMKQLSLISKRNKLKERLFGIMDAQDLIVELMED